jgi:hypothetical protein
MAWYYNRIAAKAAVDLRYSDKKSEASKTLREVGARSNIHEANAIALRAMIKLSE